MNVKRNRYLMCLWTIVRVVELKQASVSVERMVRLEAVHGYSNELLRLLDYVVVFYEMSIDFLKKNRNEWKRIQIFSVLPLSA